MARATNYKKRWEKEQWNHLITLEAFDECLIHLAKTMREGGMPERSWLFLVVHPIEMLSDWRFSDEVLEQYYPGHEKRGRAIMRAHPDRRDERICDTPEWQEQEVEFSAAKDWFTADLFRSYGFDELALLLLAAPEELERRAEESREFICRDRHHFGTTHFCWCGSDRDQPTQVGSDDIEHPDLLPELAPSAMASA